MFFYRYFVPTELVFDFKLELYKYNKGKSHRDEIPVEKIQSRTTKSRRDEILIHQ